MGFLSNLVGFQNSFTKNLGSDILSNPTRLITGVDPASTKLWNTVLGTDNKPLVNYFGSPGEQYYEKAQAEGIDTGAASKFHAVADTIAGIYGASGLSGSLGFGNLGAASGPTATSGVWGNLGNIAKVAGSASSSNNGSGGSNGMAFLENLFGGSGGGGGATSGGSGWGSLLSTIGTIGAGLYASNQQKNAAQAAAGAQNAASAQGIEEQRRQFDAVQQLLAPYVIAGTGALGAQSSLLGLGGADAQKNAVASIQSSPQFAALSKQGEDAILANASATGGLRGGNTQGALAQFRPALLSQLIDQQYSRLGGLTALGQNAAAGTGNAGMQTGNTITNLLSQQGAANAGQALAGGQANVNLANTIGKAFGSYLGSRSVNPGTGGQPTNQVF